MSVVQNLNSSFMYMLCGSIILVVALICVLFLVRAWRAGLAIGMDKEKMRRVVVSSAAFTVLPSIGILLGVIALSGSLGVPWPWLRLSVIGALHYETQVAQAAAEASGLSALSMSQMTMGAFTTICLLMSMCIMWSLILSLIFGKAYSNRLLKGKKGSKKEGSNAGSGFGDLAMTAMFVGLISAYVGSYIGGLISGNGRFSFSGDWMPLAVAAVGALAMAVFVWLYEKKKHVWAESFSVAGSMLIAMVAAVVLKMIV